MDLCKTMNNIDIANTRHSLTSQSNISVHVDSTLESVAAADVAYTYYKFKMYFTSC